MPQVADGLPALGVDGEIRFVLEGPEGTSSGTVSGHGRRVVVRTDDPVAAFRSATTPVLGSTSVAALADLLAGSGLVVEVSGPQGTVATLGDGVDSALGALIAGSRRVRPGSVRAVRPLALAQARATLSAGSRRRAGLAAVALVLTVLGRRAAARSRGAGTAARR